MNNIKKIDEILVSGDAKLANALLKSIGRRAREDPRVRAKIASLHLKFVQHLEAFRILEETPLESSEATLILANAANFLGASGYALRLLDQVNAQIKQQRPIDVAQILSTNWRDEEALIWFTNIGSDEQPAPSPSPDGARRLLLRCYPLMELQRFQEVRAIVDLFLSENLPLDNLSASYAAMFGAWAATEQGLFADAERFFKIFSDRDQSDDVSWPKALNTLVKGIYFAKLEQYRLAQKYLMDAYSRLFRRGMQPESSWMTCVYWLGFLQYKKTNQMPEEWLRLYSYPAITSSFRIKIAAFNSLETRTFLSPKGATKRKGRFHFYLNEKMYSINEGTKQKVHGPLTLLALLVIAGDYGIPVFRAIDTLWPEEPLSIKSHGKRLEQFVQRLRNMGFTITWVDNHLFSGTDNDVTVEFGLARNTNVHQAPVLPSELAGHEFSKSDVAKLLNLSNRSATRLCSRWTIDGVVARKGCGPRTRYVSPEKTSREA